MQSTLQQIGFNHGTDKSGSNYGTHTFNGNTLLDTYDKFFQSFRLKNINFLELGILDGKSLKTWEEYFPDAKIAGLDIDPSKTMYQTPRTNIYIGSQDDSNVIDSIKKDYPEGFDVILDDASHINELTIASFELLFNHVKPGGLYIIEDTCCAYGLDEYPTFENDVQTWPGMNYNREGLSFSNRRTQLDNFLLPKIKNLDMKIGPIYAFHFYSETLIIEKNK